MSAEKSTQSYTELTNKPKINNVVLDGEKSLNDLGIQAQGNYATKEELPTKISQLENDSNFISEIPVASTSTLGGIKVGDNLEITADGVLNALGGGSGAFPIIDATGEVEIDLDNYLDDGTWIIKGNNVKQMKNSVYETVKTAPFAILTIRTPNWITTDTTYQSLEFPDLAYSTSTGYKVSNQIGVRKIKPSIDARFQFFGTPTRITNNYISGTFDDSTSYAFSQSGANGLYTEIREAIGKFGTSYGLAKLTNLKTTNKSSLINAINELVDTKQDKLTAGSGITIENNVISASGGGSAGITVLEGTEETPVNLQNLTEAGLYFVKNYYIPSALYAKIPSDMLIINYSVSQTRLIQMNISSESSGRFYWRTRMYDKTTKKWDKDDFTSRYNDISPLESTQNYYTGKAIIDYYGNKTKLETTNKNNLVNAINEINAKITSGTLATNLTEIQGYDATKTQVLKNINGQFTWVQE